MKQKMWQLINGGWSVIKPSETRQINSGFSLVEVLLSITIFGFLIAILVSGPLYSEEALLISGTKNRATLLAEEGLEAVRSIRDANYNSLIPGTYGLSSDSNKWSLYNGPVPVGIFNRSIEIIPISNGITEIISTVSWRTNRNENHTVSLSTYLTQWK